MKKNDLIKQDGTIFRVLAINDISSITTIAPLTIFPSTTALSVIAPFVVKDLSM